MSPAKNLTPAELEAAKDLLARFPGLLEHYRDTVDLVVESVTEQMAKSAGMFGRIVCSRRLSPARAEEIAVALATGHLVALKVYTGAATS